MTHPRPVCSPSCLKRTCSFDVDSGTPAAKKQRNAQFKCVVRANDEVNNANDEAECIREPHAHDVLCGRGGSVNKHPGNVIFRRVVEANKERYRTSLVDHKALLSKSIVLAMRSQSPPGRFLTRSPRGDKWVEVEDAKAVQKTSQALREGSTEEESRTDDRPDESRPTRPSQEEMNKEVLRRALIGSSNCRGIMTRPEVVVSSQQTNNEISDTIKQAVIPGSDFECPSSLGADSATIEESASTCELAAATLGECLATGDEDFHLISDDESLLSPMSDADCLDALELVHDDHFHEASLVFFPEFPIDMGHWEDEHLTDLIAHKLCSRTIWEL